MKTEIKNIDSAETIKMKAVPLIGEAILDGTVETKEAAKKEQRELAQEEPIRCLEDIKSEDDLNILRFE